MKKVLAVIGGIILLLLIIVIALPFFIDVNSYKGEITARTKDATGRELVISGPLSLSLFPSISVTAEDVSFSNREGGRAEQMATLDALRVSVKLLPLITGNLQIDGFELVNPVIALEVDESGTGNWVMGDAAPAETAPAEEGGPTDLSMLEGLSLDNVRLENGRVSYWDAATNEEMVIEDINVSLSLPGYDEEFTADGSLIYLGDEISLDMSLASLKGFMEGVDQSFDLAFTTPRMDFTVDGTAHMADGPVVNGDVDLDIPSIRDLAAWAGTPLDMPGDGLGPFSISGNVAYAGTTAAFTDAEIKLDDMTATGGLSVDTGGARPNVTGRLDVDTLNLNAYMPPAEEEPAELVWSEEPIDASGLKAADLDFTFSAQRIEVMEMAVGPASLALAINNGRLTASLDEMALYEGNGSGSVTLDGSGQTLAVASDFNLSGVNSEALLKDAMDMNRLTGTLETDFSITTGGNSQKALVSALDGGGQFGFTDGEIRGVDLARIAGVIERVVNGVSDGGGNFLSTLLSGDVLGSLSNLGAMFGGEGNVDESTKFTSLTGTWTADNGVITNPDLNLVGPLVNDRALLQMTGEGDIDLPDQEIAYLARIRSFSESDSADSTGVGGTVRLSGAMTEPEGCVVISSSLCVGPGTKPADLIGNSLLGGSGDSEEGGGGLLDSVGRGVRGLFGGGKDEE